MWAIVRHKPHRYTDIDSQGLYGFVTGRGCTLEGGRISSPHEDLERR